MAISLYETQLLAARLNELELAAQQLILMDQVLRETFDRIDVLMIQMADSKDIIRKTRLTNLQAAIGNMIDDSVNRLDNTIRSGMMLSAEIARDGQLNAGLVAFDQIDSRAASRAIPPIFASVPQDAVRAVLARAWDDGKTYSDRIWDLRQFSKNEISKTVAKGVLQGQSHTALMKELEPFLKMNDTEFKAFQRVWAETHDDVWKADWKTRGRLKYNLRRLARTEINNAYREGMVLSSERAPWIKSLKWNLSASHPRPDICDTWASQDLYGLGKGIYPPREVPRDHPNGLCYITSVVADNDELQRIVSERFAV